MHHHRLIKTLNEPAFVGQLQVNKVYYSVNKLSQVQSAQISDATYCFLLFLLQIDGKSN